ncbi:hypothetical protein RND71_034543 [Anisodus tanguticus]|uniref:Uncharacterized protein n=1 Tax=Anisodus tanguticus TaxID=243964 RepID=A0AAE1V4B1_9SOLA|nr:hypothetical protein RND71_034543 [Anisodus tanguticus]
MADGQILALLNEIPASSRKYQFALGMADKIVDENTRSGHVEMIYVNRAALASAFARTSGLLYSSLKSPRMSEDSGTWPSRILRSLPLGSFVVSSLKGLSTFFPWVGTATSLFQNKRQPTVPGLEESVNDLAAEKHAQELLWITNKTVEWSVVLWMKLWCNGAYLLACLLFLYHGLSYPVLTGYEKVEMEKTMDEVISTLPTIDPEVILSNWLQDFTTTSADWPNLQKSYDLCGAIPLASLFQELRRKDNFVRPG